MHVGYTSNLGGKYTITIEDMTEAEYRCLLAQVRNLLPCRDDHELEPEAGSDSAGDRDGP